MVDKYNIVLTFTQPVLGAVSKDKELYTTYIAGKKALTDEELAKELESVENIEQRGWYGFHMEDGKPFLLAYVIKGFFKSACSSLRRIKDSRSQKLTAYKKVVDGLIFAYPQKLFLTMPPGAEITPIERPLRAQTAQGERITLVRSDSCPPGTTVEFALDVLGVVSRPLLIDWLDYGERVGIGAWRSSDKGQFVYTLDKL